MDRFKLFQILSKFVITFLTASNRELLDARRAAASRNKNITYSQTFIILSFFKG